MQANKRVWKQKQFLIMLKPWVVMFNASIVDVCCFMFSFYVASWSRLYSNLYTPTGGRLLGHSPSHPVRGNAYFASVR